MRGLILAVDMQESGELIAGVVEGGLEGEFDDGEPIAAGSWVACDPDRDEQFDQYKGG